MRPRFAIGLSVNAIHESARTDDADGRDVDSVELRASQAFAPETKSAAWSFGNAIRLSLRGNGVQTLLGTV
jgi:hypothetical protein